MEDNKIDRSVAFVLGGTIPHIELIKKLKARGYHVVLVDYLDDSPARAYADEHVQESTLDQEAVLRLARDRHASLVISAAVDQANITCCYVAEKLGLPHPYSYETSLDVTHKDRMKRIMVEGGVPTAPYVTGDELELFDERGVGYPCIVKPTNSNGSRGVRVVQNEHERGDAILLARAASRTGEFIVESFVQGIEVSAYYYVQDFTSYRLAVCQKGAYTDIVANSVRQYEHAVYPADITIAALKKLDGAAKSIVASFALRNTPLFLQAIVTETDEVFVLEFAPRLGGGLCFRSVSIRANFDYMEAAISSYLGERIDMECLRHTDDTLLIGNMFASSGVFDYVEGVDEALTSGVIREFYCTRMPGSAVSGDGSSGSRFGQFIVVSASLDDAIEKERIARSMIKAIVR